MPLAFRATKLNFPDLSWVYVKRATNPGHLFHGPSVEIFDEGFFEGCFSGDWISYNYDQSSDVFGSGMRVRGDQAVFITPSHTLEALYIYQNRHGFAVSNSLALLFGCFQLEVPFDIGIGARFATIVLGIDHYERLLWSSPAFTLKRVSYDNFIITDSGEISGVRKSDNRRFDTYASYHDEMRHVLDSVVSNAADPARSTAFTTISTCSSGYDSAAAAALYASLGGTGAVTLRKARGGEDDSGRAVAEALGLEVTELERVESGLQAAHLMMFLAPGLGGEDACYNGCAGHFAGRVVLTGFHGDKVWGLSDAPNGSLARGDVSGASLQEFRLWTPFYHVPVPMIAARHHAAIRAIADAADMQPYRLNVAYDRPVPRRMLEDMGVAREFFGQKKKAASLLTFLRPSLLGNSGQEAVRRAYRRLCVSRIRKWSYCKSRMNWRVRKEIYVLTRRLRLQRLARLIVPCWETFEHDDPINLLMLDAALHEVGGRYARVLCDAKTGECLFPELSISGNSLTDDVK